MPPPRGRRGGRVIGVNGALTYGPVRVVRTGEVLAPGELVGDASRIARRVRGALAVVAARADGLGPRAAAGAGEVRT